MALIVTSTKATHRAGSKLYPAVHHVQGETPLPVLSATGGTGTISWSDFGAGGTFTPATGASGIVYTPPDEAKSVTIQASASGSGGTGTTVIVLTSTFPIQPQIDYDIDLDDDTKMHTMRDRTRYYQVEGPAFESRSLTFLDREKTEQQTLEAFWNFHRKTLDFTYIDVAQGRTYLAKFISGLKTKMRGEDSFDMSCTIEGKLL